MMLFHTHTIHLWHIYLHLPYIFPLKKVYKYASPMDGMYGSRVTLGIRFVKKNHPGSWLTIGGPTNGSGYHQATLL